MRRRLASINDLPIDASARLFRRDRAAPAPTIIRA
jgi:nuclear transport factor 2 (NTF2) superfamily protein